MLELPFVGRVHLANPQGTSTQSQRAKRPMAIYLQMVKQSRYTNYLITPPTTALKHGTRRRRGNPIHYKWQKIADWPTSHIGLNSVCRESFAARLDKQQQVLGLDVSSGCIE